MVHNKVKLNQWLLKLLFHILETETVVMSDHLCNLYSVDIPSSESFLRGKHHPTLTVQSAGDVMHVFVNGLLSG